MDPNFNPNMSHVPLELTLISAKDLGRVNLILKMEVYAVAMIAGDPGSRKITHTDREGHRNPTWNTTFTFNVPELDLDTCMLHVIIKSEKASGDREAGEVHVPVRELLDGWKKASGPPFLSYQVRKPSGKAKGTLNFSYKFGEPVTTYPATGPSSPSGSNSGCSTEQGKKNKLLRFGGALVVALGGIAGAISS